MGTVPMRISVAEVAPGADADDAMDGEGAGR